MKRLMIVAAMLYCLSSAGATDTIRLNMQRYQEDYPLDADGKWTETYNMFAGSLVFDVFEFSHLANSDGMVGSGDDMSYWDGFTIGTSGDNQNYGMAGSSNGWITRQWGCMAGGGLDSAWTLVQGAPYLIAYWGGSISDEENHTLQMSFNDGVTHRVLGVWVCNHPWPYYGAADSDGFAHGFAGNGDFFSVTAHGLDENGHDVGRTVIHYLVQFHGDSLDQSPNWQWMDLTSLGQVSAVYFTMESSDMSGLGMNTASYFCLGGAEALEHVDMFASPKNLTATALGETEIELKWGAVANAAYYRIYQGEDLIATTTAHSYVVDNLQAYTEYGFFVQSVSIFDEESEQKYATAQTLDTTPPTMPLNLTAVANTTSIDLSWDASTDNVGVTKYTVYVNGVREARPKKTTYTIKGLAWDTQYVVEVEAMDQSNNVSQRARLVVTTQSITPTEVEETRNDKEPQIESRAEKVMLGGRIYISFMGHLYDLMGNRIN